MLGIFRRVPSLAGKQKGCYEVKFAVRCVALTYVLAVGVALPAEVAVPRRVGTVCHVLFAPVPQFVELLAMV